MSVVIASHEGGLPVHSDPCFAFESLASFQHATHRDPNGQSARHPQLFSIAAGLSTNRRRVRFSKLPVFSESKEQQAATKHTTHCTAVEQWTNHLDRGRRLVPVFVAVALLVGSGLSPAVHADRLSESGGRFSVVHQLCMYVKTTKIGYQQKKEKRSLGPRASERSRRIQGTEGTAKCRSTNTHGRHARGRAQKAMGDRYAAIVANNPGQ